MLGSSRSRSSSTERTRASGGPTCRETLACCAWPSSSANRFTPRSSLPDQLLGGGGASGCAGRGHSLGVRRGGVEVGLQQYLDVRAAGRNRGRPVGPGKDIGLERVATELAVGEVAGRREQ